MERGWSSVATKTAPTGLGPKARKFWRETVGSYELSPAEALLLEGACREIDIIERLQDELKGANLVVAGSMGQDTAHPLLTEVRMHRAAFGSIVKQLALPELEDEKKQSSPRSRQAQNAANARWGRAG